MTHSIWLSAISQGISEAAPLLPGPIALCHIDIGRGVKAADEALAAGIAEGNRPFLQTGAIVAGSQRIQRDFAELPPPGEVAPGRYFTYGVAWPEKTPQNRCMVWRIFSQPRTPFRVSTLTT